MRISSLLVLSLILFGGASVFFAAPAATGSNPSQYLGFWVQEQDVYHNYSPQAFFNAMFLTAPYPSSLEVMVFSIIQDKNANAGCSTSGGDIGESASYWGQVAQLADSYPNIRLVFEIAFDPTNGGAGTYGLSCYNALASSLAQYPSVYGIGIEGEYTTPVSALTASEVQSAMSEVTSLGKVFVNYYLQTAIPSGGYAITHTNFPDQGDQIGTLSRGGAQIIGISSGYYNSFPFPSTFTCPIGPSAVATGATSNQPQGWNQCVISTELSTAVSMSAPQRQFLELCTGFSSSGSFTGVSGQTTNELWDNPTLRNWIWTDPNYQGNFVLSTSPLVSSTTATSTSSTSSVSSSSQTTATDSTNSVTTVTTTVTVVSESVSTVTVTHTVTTTTMVTKSAAQTTAPSILAQPGAETSSTTVSSTSSFHSTSPLPPAGSANRAFPLKANETEASGPRGLVLSVALGIAAACIFAVSLLSIILARRRYAVRI